MEILLQCSAGNTRPKRVTSFHQGLSENYGSKCMQIHHQGSAETGLGHGSQKRCIAPRWPWHIFFKLILITMDITSAGNPLGYVSENTRGKSPWIIHLSDSRVAWGPLRCSRFPYAASASKRPSTGHCLRGNLDSIRGGAEMLRTALI